MHAQFARRLAEKGIETRPFFLGMHEQPVFQAIGLFQNEKYPVAERLARQGLYIPSGLTIRDDEIEKVLKLSGTFSQVIETVGGFSSIDTKNFRSTYASTYDVLYKEKNYEAECDFLEELFRRYSGKDIKRLLDMGCGTGGHAIPLARRGYKVSGIDRSPEMVAIAKQKAGAQGLSDRIRFETGNIQEC